MSSTGRTDGNVGSDQLRRPTRERKQAQHFGHSEPSADLEELIEASQPRRIAPAVRNGGKRASGKPSLWVTLPLPASIVEKPSLWVKLRLPAQMLSQLPPSPSPQSGKAPEIKIEGSSDAKAKSSTRKRTAAPLDDDDEEDLFAPSSSREPAPKRQRVKPSVRKPRATPKAKGAVKFEQDDHPEPRGQPEVWAEARQALCESLPYYVAYQSAAYTKRGFVYGFLLDNDNNEHGFMDEKVVVTRLGGGMEANKESGKMKQTKNHSITSRDFLPFLNNQRERIPLTLIVGAKNPHCPTKVPHRYNVLGLYHVTDIWSEKIQGKVVCRGRFEMIDLKTPSWWGIRGSPLPTPKPDYTTKASLMTCTACNTPSKQVSAAGWMCLNEKCTKFSVVNGEVHRGAPALNPAFINERNKWPTHIKVPLQLKPPPPTGLIDGSLMETSLRAWKGMVCRDCGRCNARTKWDEWKCETKGCTFEIPIQYRIIPPSQLVPKHAFQAEGHSIPFDKWEAPVVRTEAGFHGYWRKATYELSPGNYVTHYFANQVINRQPRGADETLKALQGANMGMQRFALGTSPVEGVMTTKHFGMNFGLPYKYVVAMDSKGFSEAPSPIMDALNHLTWAGKDAVTDGSFQPFNELLCLAYMEDQAISWHDDGEKDLGPDVASWSLGGSATMDFRVKSKHWNAKALTAEKYDPDLWVRPGSQGWKMRIEANEHYKAGRMTEYEAAKGKLFGSAEMRKHTPPIILSLDLKHGDKVVMHGEEIQKINEHTVSPKGKLRYGLTGRYIKPENIPVTEHWKGAFTIAPDEVYDGDLAVFRADFPEEEEG